MSHIVHSDFEKVGNDLINLGFLPSGQVGKEMAAEILPHLSRVLERLVKGGSTQHMDVDQVLNLKFMTILTVFCMLEQQNHACSDEHVGCSLGAMWCIEYMTI